MNGMPEKGSPCFRWDMHSNRHSEKSCGLNGTRLGPLGVVECVENKIPLFSVQIVEEMVTYSVNVLRQSQVTG